MRLDDDVVVDEAWGQGKAKAIIKFLASRPTRSAHREQLLDALWPELPAAAAGNNFRKNLSVLRAELSGKGVMQELFTAKGSMLELAPEVSVDASEFEEHARAALQSGRPELCVEALSLYAGDLLPGDRFEEWATARREQLQMLWRQLLSSLASARTREGNPSAAERALRELVTADPLDEGARRQLMEVLAASGSPAKALREYEKWREYLQSELDVEPSEETRALFDEVLAGRYVAASKPDPATTRPEDRGDDASERRKPATGRLLRMAAPAFLFSAGAVVALGLFFTAGSDDETSTVARELRIFQTSDGAAQVVSGDCTSSDLMVAGTSTAQISGDITATATSDSLTTLYADRDCVAGVSRSESTLAGAEGSTLSYVSIGPTSLITNEGANASLQPAIAMIITDGTGTYEDAVGTGSCQTTAVSRDQEDDSLRSRSQSECTLSLLPRTSLREPVLLQLGASSRRLAVFGSGGGQNGDLHLVVAYASTGKEDATGLTLSLLSPPGAEIVATPRMSLEPAESGQLSWNVPDLAPGEVASLEFSLRLLSAAGDEVEIVAEVSGDSFTSPVQSEGIVLTVSD